MLGLQAPNWPALRGKLSKANSSEGPLHIKTEVIASLDIPTLLQKFGNSNQELREALEWIDDSHIYDSIRSYLPTFIFPIHRSTFTSDDLSQLIKAEKLSLASRGTTYCNAFTVQEDKPEGIRRRPIIEPLINCVIEEFWQPQCRVTYTPKSEIRKQVFESSACLQYDFAAWFDQIQLHPHIRDLFALKSNTDILNLNVLPMGYKPSCKVAHTITKTLIQATLRNLLKPKVTWAACVDNVAFFGSHNDALLAGKTFVTLCASVKAIIKEPEATPQSSYDLLGEHYDHVAKTRCLTSKTQAKAAYVFTLLSTQTKKYFKVRQLLAVFGLLLYCAEVLHFNVAMYHAAMRFLSAVAARPLHEVVGLPPQALDQLLCWSAGAALNLPTYVQHVASDNIDLRIYVDASGLGWGALAVGVNASVRSCAFPWPKFIQSSVEAEPLAATLAIAYFVNTKVKNVVLYTDHEGLVFASKKGWGKCSSYSMAVAAFREWEQFGVYIRLEHIPGRYNPADALSRSFTPPLLPVTKIGL
ncbi:hypothetical protein JST99_00160 [Candidatus Dependentiae bacterium]|nr:hypothetical protein [Candidatus Dependentiae bacterium]